MNSVQGLVGERRSERALGKPTLAAAPPDDASRLPFPIRVGQPITECEAVIRIRIARSRLDVAEQRVRSMQATLDSVPRGTRDYGTLVERLHLLERSVFSRRLELEELLKARRREEAPPPHLGPRP